MDYLSSEVAAIQSRASTVTSAGFNQFITEFNIIGLAVGFLLTDNFSI